MKVPFDQMRRVSRVVVSGMVYDVIVGSFVGVGDHAEFKYADYGSVRIIEREVWADSAAILAVEFEPDKE